MATFGMQLQQQKALQEQKRISRTERVIERERERQEKSKNEQLSAQAERLRQDFSNLSFEEYKSRYEKLSPDLKSFFISPNEIVTKQKIIYLDRLQTWKQKVSDAQERLQKFQAYLQQRSYSNNLKERARQIEQDRQTLLNKENDVDEAQAKVDYLQSQSGKINVGYSANDLISYAIEKASSERQVVETKDMASAEFKSQLRSGKLDETISKLNLDKSTLTYEKYAIAVEKYNNEISSLKKIQSWSGKAGFENLPEYAKEKLNPDAVKWQKANPNEQLIYDSKGNVTGVKSSQFGGKTYTIAQYNKKIEEYNLYVKNAEAERLKQEAQRTEAETILKENKFGEGVSLTAPKQTFLGKVWAGAKTFWLANIVTGGGYELSEKTQKEVTEIREENIREILSPRLLFGIGVDKLVFNYPLDKSWEVIQEQRQLDYRAKQTEKLANELENLSKNQNAELKPYIETEGLKIMSAKGLETKETVRFEGFDKYGNPIETRSIEITDQALNRKISQNMLEIEKEFGKRKTSSDNAFVNLLPKTFNEAMLETRIISSKALQSYLTYKGGEYVFKEAISVTKLLGQGLQLESAYKTGTFTGEGIATMNRALKTVQLAEGTALVPKTYTLLKVGAGIGITGLYGYSKFQQYKKYKETSAVGRELFLLETTGEIAGIELASGIIEKSYNIAKSNIRNWNVPRMKEADISEQGFFRENKLLGGQEKVYMRRYQGFKLSKPDTWLRAIEGTPKGAFTERVRKLTADEVTAYYKYGGDVYLFDKKGNFVKTITAEAFPTDAPKTHYEWITKRNIREFGVAKYKELPIDVREYKGYVYSATRQRWEYVDFKPEKLYDIKTGKKIADLKGAIRFGSGKGISEGFLGIGKGGDENEIIREVSSPTVYANYLKDVKINKATGELKGISEGGIALKYPKYRYDTGALGTGNVPLIKSEVETTYEFEKALKIRTPFAIRRGLWKIPVVEEIVGKETDLKLIMNEIDAGIEMTNVGLSSMPSSTVSAKPFVSLISYPKPSKKYSKVSITSRISSPSQMSKVSEFVKSDIKSRITSRRSAMSSQSSSLQSSPVSDIIRDILRSSPPKSPPRTRIPRIRTIETGLTGKARQSRIKKLVGETLGLFPDFTARAIGLSPKEVDISGAIKEIKKLRTGFEIRTGARIKGYSPIDEKSLLAGIMK